MRALALVALLMIAPVLVGCLDSTDDVGLDSDTTAFAAELVTERVPAATEDLSKVIDPDHDGKPALHAVPELHVGAHGMELVGHNPLTRVTEGASPLNSDSGFNAVDVWNNLVCIAHFAGTTGASGGATIVDIADPANPVMLSSVEAATVNSDCQFTDDGRFLILASYFTPGGPGSVEERAKILQEHGETAVGLAVYDVQDPANPEFLFASKDGAYGGTGVSDVATLQASATGGGYHNVFTAKINGTNYIFQTYTGHILKIDENATGLERVSRLVYSAHDLWVGKHPVTGDWTVVTGAGYGTAVFNINDPESPELLGIWEGNRDDRAAGWHRQWPVDGLVDGKAYLVVAGEECGNGDTLPYRVLDWTDPNALFETGMWWIPGKPANPGNMPAGSPSEPDHLCEMNSHEFEVWNGYVASGNYHAGVWLFDVGSPERAYEPATLGYYLPSENPQTTGGTANTPFAWSPNTWGAYWDDRGYIITADWHSGLYVLEFEGTSGEWPEGHPLASTE